MSLVQAVITDNYILVGAETRAVYENTSIIYDNWNKLIKLNNEIIFGCTGGTIDNYELFKGFCIFSEEFGLRPVNTFDISYNSFINIISGRFLQMYELRHRKTIQFHML